MNIAQLMGWTIVHSVWEIAAIALLFFVVSFGLRKSTSNVRYCVALISLGACILAPLATYVLLLPNQHVSSPTLTSNSPSVRPNQFGLAKTEPSQLVRLPQMDLPYSPVVGTIQQDMGRRLAPILPSIVISWLIGLILMGLRLVGGLFVIEAMKRAKSNRFETNWQVLSDALAKRVGVNRPVTVLISERVATPAVVGFFKAIILLPASAVTKLSQADIEALLTHELAHIRRYDAVVNFAQTLIETVLFYHPAAWWISSMVRAERENCCDDIAMSVLKNREQYARALMNLEVLRPSAPHLAMAANRGFLLVRIRRIVLGPQRPAVPASTWVTLALTTAITIGFAGTLHSKQKPPAPVGLKHTMDIPVAGRVIDADGHPVAGASVLYQMTDMTTRQVEPLGEIQTDHNGMFHLDRGAQMVATKKGVGFGMVDWDAPFKATIRLLPVRQIHLRAVDASGKPVSGVTIGVTALHTQSRFEAIWMDSPLFDRLGVKTDAEGRAILSNMPAKAVVILAIKDEHYVIRQSTATLKSPRQDSEFKLVLEPAGGVEGTVTEAGRPMQRTAILAFSKDESHHDIAFTDANGHFRLMHQPAGRVLLQVRTFHSFTTKHWSDPRGQTVIVPNSVQHVDFEVDSGTPLKVRVLSPNGRPVEGLSMSVQGANTNGLPEAGGVTDKNGWFACKVSPGVHKVVFEQWTKNVSKSVTVRDGASISMKMRAPIADKFARIVCRLIDADDKPVGATTVRVGCVDFDGKEVTQQYVTSQDGKAVVLVPNSLVSSMWASAKSGKQVSAPHLRPNHGVITIHLHRI